LVRYEEEKVNIHFLDSMCALTDVLKRGFKSMVSSCKELDIMKEEMLYSLIVIGLGFSTLVAQVSFAFCLRHSLFLGRWI